MDEKHDSTVDADTDGTRTAFDAIAEAAERANSYAKRHRDREYRHYRLTKVRGTANDTISRERLVLGVRRLSSVRDVPVPRSRGGARRRKTESSGA